MLILDSMKFFTKIKDSLYSPKFYAGIPKQSFKSVFGYFFLLILLLTVVHTIVIFVRWGGVDVPQKATEKFVTSAVNYFPDNLIITLKNGSVSTNVTEPYYLPLQGGNEGEAENLL